MAEQDTKELDALLGSVNGSAERFQTLWFSFLGLTLYLAITALATTHRNLLLGEPQTLPILNIKVELLPFYVIAPLLYFVFHFYLLMMLALLARTAAAFDKQLRTTLLDEADRERYRARVENALFLQLLVGMRGERSGLNTFLLGLIAFITIALAPLATLILMQMMFLPYHHLRITWWHRAIVVADLVLILVMTYRSFFPRGVGKAPLVLGALGRKPRWATAMAFCILLAAALAPVVDWLSFSEGRWAGEPRPSSIKEWRQWIAGEPPSLPEVSPNYAATGNGVVFGLFPDRLKLSSETIVGDDRLEKTKKEMASREGNFVPTINLDDRDLQAADLSNADLRGVSFEGANMWGANLSGVQLQGADLTVAQLRAFLGRAHLEGARLTKAQLSGAYLEGARLQGADLDSAQLAGADLDEARLQGSNLEFANLVGADFVGAQMQGANLHRAALFGADLGGAQLQGANLSLAQLQSANMSHAGLQGADLSDADLSNSTFDGTFVFRTSIAEADLATAAVWSVHADQVKDSEKFGSPPEPLTPADVEAWIAAGTEFARGDETDEIVKRFHRLKPDFHEDTDQPKWGGLEEASRSLDPDGVQHRQRLAMILGALVCGPYGAPYLARRVIRNYRREVLGDFVSVRARMEDGRKTPEKCPGVAGFTESDWLRLEAIRPAQDRPSP
jgi:uncharacterized protein YjbI with pentapeptide repeats